MSNAPVPPGLAGAGRGLMALSRYADVALAVGVVGVLIVLVIPIPTQILDLLLCCQIALALAVIMGTLYCVEPLEFNGFPSLLLFVTLFRLALNVASSRLILLNGDAGTVIQSFGDFVVGGNYFVGFTIFLILMVINFIVITKGSGRVAEVAARFTLDAMPGKQMAIDADLNAGLIDETQARQRRSKIERESSFFGSMDGASKFVRGDAIAGLIITAINILGGLAVGVMQRGMGVEDALHKYALLTIGDGLVTQIPALLVSTAAGVLVTRSASEFNLGQDLGRQLLVRARPIQVCAVFLLVFALIPGLPTVPFLCMSLLFFYMGWMISRNNAEKEAELALAGEGLSGAPGPGGGPGGAGKKESGADSSSTQENMAPYLKMDAVELELGTSLVPLAQTKGSGDLLSRISQIRKRLAGELGIVVPPVRVHDNLRLPPRQYRLRVRGAAVMEGELFPERLLAINPNNNARTGLQGTPTTDPAFGLPAYWITKQQRSRAEAYGYTVVDAVSVLSTHMQETLRSSAADLLSRQDVQAMVERVKETDPAVVKDVIPGQVSLPVLHRVLQGLLRERVAVRDLITVLETLGDRAGSQESVDTLVEHVRLALAPAFVSAMADPQGKLHALTFEPELESRLLQSMVKSDQGPTLILTPVQVPRLMKALEAQFQAITQKHKHAVLICSANLRNQIQRFVDRALPKMPVLSYLEVPGTVNLNIGGQISAQVMGDTGAGLFGADQPAQPNPGV